MILHPRTPADIHWHPWTPMDTSRHAGLSVDGPHVRTSHTIPKPTYMVPIVGTDTNWTGNHTVFYETCYPELFTAHTPCLPNLATWYRAMDAQRCGLYSGFIEENFEKITKNWKICNKIEKFRVLRSYEMGLSWTVILSQVQWWYYLLIRWLPDP